MRTILTKARRGPEVRRFARFLVVGLSGTVIDFVLLWLLKGAGMPTLAANSLSFSAGAVSNFTWNRLWTFREARGRHWVLQMAQFLAVSLVGLAINDAVVLLLQAPLGSLLGHPEQGYLPAKVVATGVAVLWNYAGNRLWTFKDAGRSADSDAGRGSGAGSGAGRGGGARKEVRGHAA
jgi:putative flippase GtrA